MSAFGRFSTVRSRLLALMAVIVIPLAILSLVIAAVAYRSIVSRAAANELQITADYAIRARVWFVTSVRSLISLGYTAAPFAETPQGCGRALEPVMKAMRWWEAVTIRYDDGRQCFAGVNTTISRSVATTILSDQAGLPSSRSWTGTRIADYRFDATLIGGKPFLVIYMKHKPDAETQGFDGVLILDPALFAFVLDLGADRTDVTTALMSGPDTVIVQRGASRESENAWLPVDVRNPDMQDQWRGVSRDGVEASYVAHLVSEPNLFMLSRFDDSASRAALIQLGFLSLTPLLLLGLLYIAYARGIQGNVIRWVSAIEAAARSRIRDPLAIRTVPIEPGMPDDIRSVAEAFNTMVTESAHRETSLTGALNANRSLMRELHHRVKNSLQVIQSYLALSRRQSSTPDRGLTETEAKVLVLSIAYRLTLTENGMQTTSVRTFIKEVIGHMEHVFGRPEIQIVSQLTGDGGLVVERLIPLGLAVVEGVIAGVHSSGVSGMTIELKTETDGQLRLEIRAANDALVMLPPSKILSGLAAQLEAQVHQLQPGEVLNWTFRA
jgi:two-component system, sensor histidine kinase PdtaS